MTYTIDDVKHLITDPLTSKQTKGVEDYLNHGIIPAYDGCSTCDSAYIRGLIATIQTAKKQGRLPAPKEEVVEQPDNTPATGSVEPTADTDSVAEPDEADGAGNITDPDASFSYIWENEGGSTEEVAPVEERKPRGKRK